ncbi:PqqD family protein [Microbacterium aureliae]
MEARTDAVYVARLPDGPIVVLDAVAGIIWEEACASEDAVGIVERVALRTQSPPAEIAPAVRAFLDELVDVGLLVTPPSRRIDGHA